ncbi:MAG: (Na+)-NQR maturation NqrM [Motiliproteus sp.]|nr:(Na+)-NQR maturation NqrM [Motiliproteus sp.]
METVILAIVVLGVLIAAMSIGVIMGRKPIKGSCGGVSAALGEKDYICPVCGDDPNKCEKEEEAEALAQQQTEDNVAYELKQSKD